MKVDERRIAVLGGGKIGEALISGLLSSELARARRHRGDGPASGAAVRASRRYGIRTTLSNPEAAARAALIVIAVKPQDIDPLLAEIADVVDVEQTVLTIAAAIPTSRIERALQRVCPSFARCRTRPPSCTKGWPASAPAPRG